MNPNAEGLYFVAVIPEGPLYKELEAQKQEIADALSIKAALKSPTHITLHMPFRLKLNKENTLFAHLSDIAKDMEPLTISLENYGYFPPKVIHVQVRPTDELRALHVKIIQQLRLRFQFQFGTYGDRGFHPHITLAFRDIKKAQATKLWEELKERHFQADFLCNHLCLLKHNGKNWVIYQRFPFGSLNVKG